MGGRGAKIESYINIKENVSSEAHYILSIV